MNYEELEKLNILVAKLESGLGSSLPHPIKNNPITDIKINFNDYPQ